MNASVFDPELFASRTVEGEMPTRREPVPEGEYTALIEDVVFRSPKEGMVIMDVQWMIDDPALAERLSLQKVTCRQSIFLDLNADGSLAIGPNKNVQLGRLRAAVRQNTGGAWSPTMLKGAGPCHILVAHKIDGEDVYDNVVKVTGM